MKMKTWAKSIAAAALAILLILLRTEPWLQRGSAYRLPVLMYHHFDSAAEIGTIVTEERFREQMTALKGAGYTTVTLQQVLDFVERGEPLPARSVLITMDDGYASNVTVAAPILEEMGFCATVFVIGSDAGREFDIHSGNPHYPPRFSYEEAIPWVEKGVLDLQSHTFDMHQLASDGFSGRDGILPLPGESMTDYYAALHEDMVSFRSDCEEHGYTAPIIALAYPFGYYSEQSETALWDEGIRMTFTTTARSNLLRVGDESCLWNMGRYNVTDHWTGRELVNRLNLT